MNLYYLNTNVVLDINNSPNQRLGAVSVSVCKRQCIFDAASRLITVNHNIDKMRQFKSLYGTTLGGHYLRAVELFRPALRALMALKMVTSALHLTPHSRTFPLPTPHVVASVVLVDCFN